MKDDDTTIATLTKTTVTKRESSDDVSVGKRHYKFWLIIAIVLLALWSMFTGSISLKFSAPNLIRLSKDFDSRIPSDIDVLEVEERKKVVRRMWDLYTHSNANRLPRFWSEAFQAAYGHLVSDVSSVRDAAVSEIAKMSLSSYNSEHLPLQSESSKVPRKIKQKSREERGH